MRFVLIDRIIEQDLRRIVAVKAVSAAEEYLADHFPGFAVLPGVMMLEAMTQAARHLARTLQPQVTRPWVLAEVRGLRYGTLVRPGQVLQVEVTARDQPAPEGPPQASAAPRLQAIRLSFNGVSRIDGQTAAQGRLTLAPLPEPPVPNAPTAADHAADAAES